MRKLLSILCLVGLVACEYAPDPLKIGGKDFTESTILSERMAILAEDAGIAVTRRTNLGDTRVNLESLRRGDIDVYAEYNGTGLVMLGQPAMSGGDAAMDRVRSLYRPLDLLWGKRFGFANNYGLAMRRGKADELGIATISDLVGEAGTLTIGIDENFQTRPLDGYRPVTARYGMEFGRTSVVAPQERVSLYDRLLDGSVDLIEVFTTDGQIADLSLLLLEDDLDFFAVETADLRPDGTLDMRPVEAYGAVGQAYVHLVGLHDTQRLADVTTLATGPEGSASHRAAQIIATARGDLSLSPADTIPSEGADAALVLAPLGSPVVQNLLRQGRLIGLDGWGEGNNLVRFPQLREARIPAGTYDGQLRAVETLFSQLILAGPVETDTDAVGPQGPGASLPTDVAALTGQTVLALNVALGSSVSLDPAIRAAPALAPKLPSPPAAVNPSPAISLLTGIVLIMLAWVVWLYVRPERR